MKGGRPTKLTAKLRDRIADAIRAGNYVETAAALAGVSKKTLYNWMRRGARARYRADGTPYKVDRPYVEFLHAVEKAQAEAIDRDLSVIDRAAQGGRTIRTVKRKFERDGDDLQLIEEILEVKEAAPEWHAAAWRLERRNPAMFGRRVSVDIEPEDIDLNGLSDEALDRIAKGEDVARVLTDEGGGGTPEASEE